jgi:hypothetical protein
MGKKRKPKKQGGPKGGGRKNEIFTPKRDDNRFPQMQKMSTRGASKASGHNSKKK